MHIRWKPELTSVIGTLLVNFSIEIIQTSYDRVWRLKNKNEKNRFIKKLGFVQGL